VVERGYSGGRLGPQRWWRPPAWSTEINIRLMQESVELCRRFAVDIASTCGSARRLPVHRAQYCGVARLEKNIAVQNRCGVRPDARARQASAIVPSST